MTEYYYKYREKLNIPPCVMALGFFDGIHVGHRELLSRARRRADELSLPLGVFTFASDSKIKAGTPRIYSDRQKAEILSELGVDFIIFADFNSVRLMSDLSFAQTVLADDFNVKCAVCGYNYRFGLGASGNANDLEIMLSECGVECIVCEKLEYFGWYVSTSLIREFLSHGNVFAANKFLGEPLRIGGTVTSGNGVGHSLGYPTINTACPSPSLLKYGVYASAVRIGDKIYKALTNVGICPTFTERKEHLETYILNFEGDLYGKNVTVYLLDFIREEKKFSTEKELIMQINIDKNTVLHEIGDYVWEQIGQKLQ
ncbi:MAG: riboflavin biosynthesis protein RibF [Clostridia bacterium]|nr:riboflavin biosynthesis protein RibF [Clostridia bacterium]